MKIQLNAATEDDDNMEETIPTTSSSLLHAVRMSSLLSHDVNMHEDDTPSASHSGLSSLMNSPLMSNQEDEIVLSQESEIVENELDFDTENVEMEEKEEQKVSKLSKLQTTELVRLQKELYAALMKLWTETGPAPKRQKKGKQSRKARAAAVNTSNAAEMEVYRVLDQLQDTVSIQFAQKDVLRDVVKLCLFFCELLDEKEPIQSLVVLKTDEKKKDAVDLGKTVSKLLIQPLYGQFVAVLRRAVICEGETREKVLLTQVLDWCLARPKPSNWTWMFVSIAEMNSYCVQEFLLREAISRYQDTVKSGDQVQHFLPVLEILTEKYPANMVDILRDVLEECASSNKGSAATIKRLVAIASDSAVLVAACDDNLQWIVTEEFVTTLASKFGEEENVNMHTDGMDTMLLDFVCKRSAELSNSGFQMLLLLQNLSALDSSPRLAASVASFQQQLREVAGSEPLHPFVKGIYRFLPYICQSTLRLLRTMTSIDKTSDFSMTFSSTDKVMSRETASRRFEEWKQWLYILAQSISRKEVTELLIKTDLMLAELNDVPLALPLTTAQPADRAFCELLTSLLVPGSPEYVNFVRSIMHECQSAAPKAQRRVLGIVQILLNFNEDEDRIVANRGFPVNLSAEQEMSCMQQLAQAENWSETLDSFDLWKGVRGVEFWESFLGLTRSKDSLVASRALSLVSRIPFLSLEDPVWQYRCVQKLSGVFFSTLRQYRSELVMQGEKTSSERHLSHDCALQSRLHTFKMIIFRVLSLDGGVAHYQSSIYSMFASLWLDALLCNTSATSIPTHFPSSTNLADLETHDDDGLLDDRQIIRCERTISSKCTNLQSSQVITKVADAKLVYRKTLDLSWEREMHAACVCGVYATDLFSQLLASTGAAVSLLTDADIKDKSMSNTEMDEQFEWRLKTVVDMLLERMIPCCGIPSDDVYKDMLPNRSSFDVDLRVEQWLNHYPAFLPLLRSVVSCSTVLGSSQLLRLVPVFKSALIVLLGHWNSVKGELSVENVDVPPYMRNQNQLAITCELMRLLRATNWLPVPLGKTAELLPLTTPADIRSILFSCWFYLSDHPPKTGSRAPTPATSATTSPISSGSSPVGFRIAGLSTGGFPSTSSHPPLEFYLIPLRKALHRNIRKIGVKYPLFSC
ncbi:unnamed protein product [Peronospora belbahrii]|uniref:Integrator complex subunit 5 C-terminal domain-containing protein n=1 Tax=Peronospora belbahrii TaxID=622444 RepID=A0ABN8D9M4_9STRA|nr:unnamed protein product [Peronospora belbahrii]